MTFPRNPRRGRGRTITTHKQLQRSKLGASCEGYRTLKVIIDKSGILNHRTELEVCFKSRIGVGAKKMADVP